MLILSVAISGEFNRASSKAYAEEQIYKTQMLLTSISAVEQQGTQHPTKNQTEMQQSPSSQNATIHAFEDASWELLMIPAVFPLPTKTK